MKATSRRFNLGQAHKLSGMDWCTMKALQRCGAYGSVQSIHRAMRRMMLTEDAAALARTKDGWVYRITPTGYAKLGMVAHKIQGEDHGRSEGRDDP